ncbi:unnamed protein product [Meganyctiphanes norvegica]|uniref:Barrier-to-autointegration factor-like protein n=1 Tax=Meganyctiphanes norvegica TaxID=48144 RepID=A0AAV2RM69_MEGNR
MSTTSQKHRNFVAEPMGEKEVNDLAGIGPVLGGRLSTKGFDKGYLNYDFVAEPMGEKAVSDLEGIGPVLGERLASRGYNKAYVVLGQFLVLKKNKELFIDWLQDTSGANSKQAGDCYQCLSDWCEEFL